MIKACLPYSSKTDFFLLPIHSDHRKNKKLTALIILCSSCHDTIHGPNKVISLHRIRVRITVILELLGLLLTWIGEAQEYEAYTHRNKMNMHSSMTPRLYTFIPTLKREFFASTSSASSDNNNDLAVHNLCSFNVCFMLWVYLTVHVAKKIVKIQDLFIWMTSDKEWNIHHNIFYSSHLLSKELTRTWVGFKFHITLFQIYFFIYIYIFFYEEHMFLVLHHSNNINLKVSLSI